MKYLVHLKPEEHLAQAIFDYRSRISQYITNVSANILHLTIMVLQAESEKEAAIIGSLESITTDKLQIEPDQLDLFDESTLVLKIKPKPPLMTFHNNVIESLRSHINWDETPHFEGDENRKTLYKRYASSYVKEFYRPHISIAQVNPDLLQDKEFNTQLFSGQINDITQFYLSKREPDGWKTIKSFSITQNP